MGADLHVHTTASDGTRPPREIMRMAQAMGLRAVAITDHDTISGVAEALDAGAKHGIDVVPGVEINTEFNDRETHILGYYVDTGDAALLNALKGLAEARVHRAEAMVTKLRNLGLAIDMDHVRRESEGGTLGRPHVAAALLRLGLVATREEAFHTYIGRGGPAYVSRTKLSPADAVAIITSAGGVPVLAHPGTVGDDALIRDLSAAGLRGLEVYHPEHDATKRNHYLGLAMRYGLIVTGGSDYHGSGHHAELGEVTVPYSTVKALQEARRV